jgi:NitT/TauT family transport system substrate-binding protein
MKLPAGEIWHKDKGIITYSAISEMLDAAKKYKADKTLRSSYVYDDVTGLKLFGKVAIYVKSKDGKYTAFMRKPDAEKFIASNGGEIFTFTKLAATGNSLAVAKLN